MRDELSFELISERRASVYGRYAHAMNEIKIWTSYKESKLGRILIVEQVIVSLIPAVCGVSNMRRM